MESECLLRVVPLRYSLIYSLLPPELLNLWLLGSCQHWQAPQSESEQRCCIRELALGVSKGGFLRGGEISIIGVVRAPVAIINFAFFVRGLLIDSYINSEIFTGI